MRRNARSPPYQFKRIQRHPGVDVAAGHMEENRTPALIAAIGDFARAPTPPRHSSAAQWRISRPSRMRHAHLHHPHRLGNHTLTATVSVADPGSGTEIAARPMGSIRSKEETRTTSAESAAGRIACRESTGIGHPPAPVHAFPLGASTPRAAAPYGVALFDLCCTNIAPFFLKDMRRTEGTTRTGSLLDAFSAVTGRRIRGRTHYHPAQCCVIRAKRKALLPV